MIIALFIGFQASKVTQDFAIIHRMIIVTMILSIPVVRRIEIDRNYGYIP